MRESTCKQRVRPHYRSRITQIKRAIELNEKNPNFDGDESLSSFMNDLLEITPRSDYTVRVLFSTGGPADGMDLSMKKIRGGHAVKSAVYWFQDWWDYASIPVTEKDLPLIQQVFDHYLESIEFPFEEEE